MKRLLAVLSTMLALAATSAFAQTYPTRPVTIIVPFAAGGPTAIIARIVGEYFSKSLGQQFIVENVAGAGGTTGITRGAQARPDGYTIMMGHMGTHGAAPALYPNLKYDPTKDFEPIGLAAGTPILIVARKDFPAADLKEFVARLKDPAAKVRQAHAGVGSVSFTTCTLLTSQLGVKNIVAAYRGTGPALNDLVGGQVDYMCDQIVNLVEQINGGVGLCHRHGRALAGPARRSYHQGGRASRLPGERLERAVRAQGHTQGDRGEAQRNVGQGTRRRCDA